MNELTSIHCPKCGQQQTSNEIRYCSRCGFLLTGVSEIVANDGVLPAGAASDRKLISPRKRGLKQGLFIFLLSFLIVPVLVLLSVAVNAEPTLAILATILLVAGGFLRMSYALLFESAEPGGAGSGITGDYPKFLKRKAEQPELAAPASRPAAAYTAPGTGSWRDTNDLAVPQSVTDSTTRLLGKETGDQ